MARISPSGCLFDKVTEKTKAGLTSEGYERIHLIHKEGYTSRGTTRVAFEALRDVLRDISEEVVRPPGFGPGSLAFFP